MSLIDALVVITTTAEEEQAKILARLLVEQRLAACVQIIAHIKSFYRWQGQVECAGESLIVIKTTHQAYPSVEAAIKTFHRERGGYETPEIVALPIASGAADYLAWLSGTVTSGSSVEG